MLKKIVFFIAFIPFISQAQIQILSAQDTTDLILQNGDNSILQKSKEMLQNSENQTFISEFKKKFGKDFEDEFQYNQLLTKNVDEWEMELYEKRLKQNEFYKSYPNKSKLTPEFQKWVENQIRFNYWHLLLAYSIIRSNKDTKLTRVVSLPAVMTENLDPSKVNDESAMTSEAYRNFLPFFITYFNSRNNKFEKYGSGATDAEKAASNIKSVTDKATLAQQFLKGKTLDYTLTKLVYDNCNRLSASTLKYWISQIETVGYQQLIKEHCKEILLKPAVELVKKKDEKEEKPTKRATGGNFPVLTDLKGNKFTFEDFKGKVIYVDFWASWCGPCRQQFPYSKKIHEELTEKEKKKVVFLYVSIDDEPESWKKAIEQLKLDKGEHGFSPGGWNSDVVQKFQINGIPRYMIIDKKGEIVNPEAPRPSDPSILELLRKYMSEI